MPTVRVLPGEERIEVREGETILEALYAAGLAYRTGCRRGGCTVCKVDLRSGSVSYRKPVAESVMTREEYANGTCLTCVAVPVDDVAIELREETLRVKCRPLLQLRLVPSQADAEPPHESSAGS